MKWTIGTGRHSKAQYHGSPQPRIKTVTFVLPTHYCRLHPPKHIFLISISAMCFNLCLWSKGLNSLLSGWVDLQTTIWCSHYKGEILFSIWAIREVVSYASLLGQITHITGSTPAVNAQKAGANRNITYSHLCVMVFSWTSVQSEVVSSGKRPRWGKKHVSWTLFSEVWSRQLKLNKLFPFYLTGVAPAFIVQNVAQNL